MWLATFELLITTIVFIACKGVGSFAVDPSDFTCAPYDGGVAGQSRACVCNSSYCDVIKPPVQLPNTQFHHYSTSKARPGFTHTTGTFGMDGPLNQEDVVMTVNASVQYQEILGFGGALTDSVGSVFNSLPQGAQDKFMESYFGDNGIGYSFVRVPIGSTDFSLRKYTLNDVPYDANMKLFNLTEESFIYQIPLIRRAQSASRRGIRLLASAWLVPGWMKQNSPDQNIEAWLDPHSYDALSEYHAKSWTTDGVIINLLRFVEAYRDEGLNMWAVTGGNEVMLFTTIGFKAMPRSKRLNSTLMTADAQRDWLRRLKPRLGSDVKFITLDDNRFFLPYWMKRMELDANVLQKIDGVALHWYGDWLVPPTLLDEFHQRYPEKLILYTESSINMAFTDIPVLLGSWDRAEYYVHNIIENLNHWTHAYMDWNLALNMEGGPSLNLFVDAPVLVNETSGEFYKQPMFYALGHFSKFIPPGAKRIWLRSNQAEVRQTKYSDKLLRQRRESMASVRVENKLGNIVPYPPLPTAVEGLAATNPDGSCTIIVFNPKNVSVHVTIQDSRVGSISTTIEEDSINTFIYWTS